MLVRLLNAPLRIQRLAALALLALVLSLVLAAAAATLSSLGARASALRETRERAGRLAQIAALKETVARSGPLPANAGESLFIEAESITIARANLQSRIGAIVEGAGATVASAGNVPEIVENGLTEVGIRADISGSHEAIQKTILEIETAKPPLLIREISVRSTSGDLVSRAPELSAQIHVFGVYRGQASEQRADEQSVGANQ